MYMIDSSGVTCREKVGYASNNWFCGNVIRTDKVLVKFLKSTTNGRRLKLDPLLKIAPHLFVCRSRPFEHSEPHANFCELHRVLPLAFHEVPRSIPVGFSFELLCPAKILNSIGCFGDCPNTIL